MVVDGDKHGLFNGVNGGTDDLWMLFADGADERVMERKLYDGRSIDALEAARCVSSHAQLSPSPVRARVRMRASRYVG